MSGDRPRPATLPREVALVEVLDRALGAGVVVSGDLALALADVDLVDLSLRLVVGSSGTVRGPSPQRGGGPPTAVERDQAAGEPAPGGRAPADRAPDPGPGPPAPTGRPRRIDGDEDDVARGLAQLVLTLVELLRQLMERQAVRRVEAGDLDDGTIERLGRALIALERQMDELKATFGFTDADLNLDLGPLGRLL